MAGGRYLKRFALRADAGPDGELLAPPDVKRHKQSFREEARTSKTISSLEKVEWNRRKPPRPFTQRHCCWGSWEGLGWKSCGKGWSSNNRQHWGEFLRSVWLFLLCHCRRHCLSSHTALTMKFSSHDMCTTHTAPCSLSLPEGRLRRCWSICNY